MADGRTTRVPVETQPGKRKRAPLTEEAKKTKRGSDRNRGKTRVKLGHRSGIHSMERAPGLKRVSFYSISK